MKRLGFVLPTGLLISIFTCAMVWAQATAQISGTVRDQTGAVLPGVEITATQTGTGITRNVITNETGSFVLPNLAVGPYRLEAALPGFRSYVQTGIQLQVNDNPVINVTLEVGQVTEAVEVQANAALVETRNVGVGQTMENERILELPLNGRNVNDLITLSGGAVQTGTTGSKEFAGSPVLSVAGGVQYGTVYLLDGAVHNDVYGGSSLPMPFPDALQEFKVETSGLSAQTGKASSVGAVTKSGTNELHGDVFDFARNDLFNARQYYATTNSTLKRHQFGGTVGGPIIHNKLFFFGGFQGTTLRQDPADIQRYVPTAAMLAGDWTAVTSPQCNAGRQITLSAPFVNNRIDPVLYSRAALNITGKLPKSQDPCGLVTFGRLAHQNDGMAAGKVDYQLTNNHSVFGRFMTAYSKITHPMTFTPDNILNTNSSGYDNLVQSYILGDTHLIGPSTVNAFRLSVNRMATYRIGWKYFGPQDVGINAYSYLPKFLNLTVSGSGFVIGGGTLTDSTTRATSYWAVDDVSLVRGNHQMGFGANLGHGRSNTNSNSQSPGGYTFNGQATGLGMSDFLLGRLSSFSQGGPSQLYQRQWFMGLYAQDTWKASRKLTINLGARWEPYLPPSDAQNRVYNFSYDRFRQGIYSTVFKNAPAGFYYSGDPGFPERTGVNRQFMDISPRVGLAWDPHGDGRMSVRASYALSFEYLPLRWRENSAAASPWGKRLTLSSPAGGLDDPWRGIAGGNPFPFTINGDTTFSSSGVFLTTPYDIKTPYDESWNVSVQREVGGMLASVSYMGTTTIHMWGTRALNAGVFFPGSAVNGVCTANGYTLRTTGTCSTTGNLDARRPLTLERPQDGVVIGNLDEFDQGATQSYHGMLLSVQRQASRGVSFTGNYTWSHCIGDKADTTGSGPADGAGYLDPNNRRFDRGNCTSDRRHVFNLTAVAATPEFANPKLRMVATGWRLSGIFRRSTGSYLTITSGTDRALTGIGSQTANQVLENPYQDKSAGPSSIYLNSAAFAIPALGTLGSMGRANIVGPGTWQFDAALSRAFQLREDQRLELRAEAYNLTNSFRPQNPTTALNGATFGQIRTSLDPRIMQFALKYVF